MRLAVAPRGQKGSVTCECIHSGGLPAGCQLDCQVARIDGLRPIKEERVIRDELKRGRYELPGPSCTCVARSDAITGHTEVHKAQAEFASPVISKKMASLHDWI